MVEGTKVVLVVAHHPSSFDARVTSGDLRNLYPVVYIAVNMLRDVTGFGDVLLM
jgi:hypothetical protein